MRNNHGHIVDFAIFRIKFRSDPPGRLFLTQSTSGDSAASAGYKILSKGPLFEFLTLPSTSQQHSSTHFIFILTLWVGSVTTLTKAAATTRYTCSNAWSIPFSLSTQVNNCQTDEHKAALSHEVIGGAAAYEVRLYRLQKIIN